MMPRNITEIITALVLALALSIGVALAQEGTPEPTPSPAPTPETVTVEVDGVTLRLPADEALAAYAWATSDTPHGQFVTLAPFANVADVGMTRLTPCDDVRVMCEMVTVRAEGVSQGDTFGLGFIEDGS